MAIKGFKAMNKDMTCLGFTFVVGKTYETRSLVMCSTGFHFCERLLDVYNYYPKNVDTIICEVEAVGRVEKEGDKSVTDTLKIIRRLDDRELLVFFMNNGNSGYGNSGDWNSGNRNSGYGNSGDWNSGNRNSGDWNSGNRNSGNRNSGDWNSGNRNSGDWNSGDWNSGDGNSGNWNSGNRNSGNRNSGYGNSGNRNSGDWNSGDGNSGYFNTTIPVYLFNKPSTLLYTQEFEVRMRALKVKPVLEWIAESLMTAEEKTEHPSSKTTGGFLRKTGRHDWRHLTEDDKIFIKNLPNFDDAVFQQIAGISLLDEIEVTIAGVVKRISKDVAKKLGLI